jgi:magnesium-transporting ATPase (P-type)
MLLNEQRITGLYCSKPKKVIMADNTNDKFSSNILYSNSFLVQGSGTAMVCAVGKNT